MKYRSVVVIYSIVVFAISGCAAQAPKLEAMSIEDAQKLQANFNLSQYKYLPRDISQIKAELGPGGPIPEDCTVQRRKSRELLESKVLRANRAQGKFAKDGASRALVTAIRYAEISGRYNQALEIITRGIGAAETLAGRNSGPQLMLFSKKASLLAKLGQVETAKKYMGIYIRSSKSITIDGRIAWIKGSTGQVFLHSGLAAIAYAEGKLAVAEQHYRLTLKDLEYNSSVKRYLHLHEVKSDLTLVLLQQGRLTEAESVGRNAVGKIGMESALAYANWPPPSDGRAKKKIHEIEAYNGINAGPVAMLALVFLEQGRLEDANYLARIAVNMHEVGCSEPDSLGLNRARSVLIRILAQQENWEELLRQVKQIEIDLRDHAQLFERQFGSTLDVAEAEINSGDARLGQSILDNRLQSLNEGSDQSASDAYELAVIQGLKALALSRLGEQKEASLLFSAAFPVLVRSTPIRDGANLEGRKKRIFSGYVRHLHGLVQSGNALFQGIEVSRELFDVVSATQASRVHNALTASRVRSTTSDPELAKLIRQHQDLGQEAEATAETLALINFSMDIDISQVNPEKLEKRLQAINSASQLLIADIDNRFPQYAELTRPHLTSIEEAAAYLKPAQVLLIYHNEVNYSYLWMIHPGGEFQFRILQVGRELLNQQVRQLRQSVDPQFIESISDIPEFDLEAASRLYDELLKPVESELANSEEILVVPGASLGMLPFSLLVTERSDIGKDTRLLFEKYRNVNWLSRHYSIVQLPSVNTLREISYLGARNVAGNRKAFVGFGDPYFHPDQSQEMNSQMAQSRSSRSLLRALLPKNRPSSTQPSVSYESAEIDIQNVGIDFQNTGVDISVLPRLPGTRDEILAIADALNADIDTDLFFGRRASEANVVKLDLAGYRVISFATHGLIPGDLNGLHQPALALTNPAISGDLDSDGLLTATETLGLKLSADMVILSACNTAAADGRGAEALSGLGRSFFYAGARSILASNWPVHSVATTELMSRLFETLSSNPGMTRSQALRQSQLQMIDELGYRDNGQLAFSYAHPLFWAPFTLSGDGGAN